jgi:hypothetical protein
VNLILEFRISEQKFLIGFNDLHLFLDYKGKNFLYQSIHIFNPITIWTVNWFKGDQLITALSTWIDFFNNHKRNDIWQSKVDNFWTTLSFILVGTKWIWHKSPSGN